MTVLTLKPISSPKTLKEMAYAAIKEAILTGGMKPDEIFSEPSLSEMLNISRTPVREALQDLVAEGYVQTLPKRGYKVVTFEPDKIEYLYDYRMAIELAIVKQVAGKIDKYQMMEIEHILRVDQLAAQEEDMASFVRTNREFHRYLAMLTNNPYFMDSIDKLFEMIEWAALHVQNRTRRPPQAVQEHLEIFQALKDNDAQRAHGAMEAHLLISKRLAKKEMDAGKSN